MTGVFGLPALAAYNQIIVRRLPSGLCWQRLSIRLITKLINSDCALNVSNILKRDCLIEESGIAYGNLECVNIVRFYRAK